jgi:hypothetical protein
MGLVDNASRAMQMLRWGYALLLVMGVMQEKDGMNQINNRRAIGSWTRFQV